MPGGLLQDSEADVDAVFQENLQFALDSRAPRPTPTTRCRTSATRAPSFVPNAFAVSYGDPQMLEVNAKKALGAVNGTGRSPHGGSGSAPMSEWEGGLRSGAPGTYYHHMRATVTTGATPRSAGRGVVHGFYGQESQHFTYTLASDSGARVLLVVDYRGASSLAASCRPRSPTSRPPTSRR